MPSRPVGGTFALLVIAIAAAALAPAGSAVDAAASSSARALCPKSASDPYAGDRMSTLVSYSKSRLEMLAPEGWSCELRKTSDDETLSAVPGDGALGVSVETATARSADGAACEYFAAPRRRMGSACGERVSGKDLQRIDATTARYTTASGSSSEDVGWGAVIFHDTSPPTADKVLCVLPRTMKSTCDRVIDHFLTGHGAPTSRAVAHEQRPVSHGSVVRPIPCATQSAYTGDQAPPSTIRLHVSLPAGLRVYANASGRIIAPAGWSCRASVYVTATVMEAFPRGEDVGRRFDLKVPTPLGIVARFDPRSAGSVPPSACRYFRQLSTAVTPCGQGAPVHESSDHFSRWVYLFEDLAGVKGSGQPSGGPYPANGFVSAGGPAGSHALYAAIETCTLPESEHALCTAILNDAIDEATS